MLARRSMREDSKVSEMCKRLRDLAIQLGPDTQLPPMRALYTELETNRITLGEALRILEAEQVLYRRERQGIYVSPKIHQRSIHVLLNESVYATEHISPFWHLLWARLAQEAKRRRAVHNESCTFHLIQPAIGAAGEEQIPEDIEDQLRSPRIDGILSILLGTKNSHWLAERALPCVTFAGSGDWLVNMDTRLNSRLAVQQLAQRGCTRLGLWVLKYQFALTEREEYQGFCDALSEHHLPFYPHLAREATNTYPHTLSLQEQGYWLAREVFTSARETWPDGLFIADDMLTDGTLVALEELAIQVGKDIQIISHATTDSPILFGCPKQLTLLEDDPNDIAQNMFALLDQLLSTPTLPKQSILLTPHIKQDASFHVR